MNRIKRFFGKTDSKGEKRVFYEFCDTAAELFPMFLTDGFEWGVYTSKAEDLSLQLITSVYNINDALLFCREFTVEIVAKFGENWEISADEIKKWVTVRRPAL